MPRDGSDTRARLLREAARLLAGRGTHQVTNREIIEAAGQKNTSALSYHFGDRGDLLAAILSEAGPALDEQRGRIGGALDHRSSTSRIVEALLVPYAGCLLNEAGRHYVQIVDQLRGQFDGSHSVAGVEEPHLRRLLGLIDARPSSASAPVRRERMIAMVTLMTAVVAERARTIEANGAPTLDHMAFVDNLNAMLVGIIEAPALHLAVDTAAS